MLRLDGDDVVVKRGLTEVQVGFPGAGDVVEELLSRAATGADPDSLAEGFDPALRPEVAQLVTAFRARGLLPDGVADGPVDLFWLSMRPYATDGPARLAASSAVVLGSGPVAEAVLAGLVASGVGRTDTAPLGTDTSAVAGYDVWCAAAEGPADPTLLPVADAAQRAGQMLVTVWLDDLLVRVGPTAHPGDTACLRCYLLRVDSNDPKRELHRSLRRSSGGLDSGGFLPGMAFVAGHLAALEVVKHLAGIPVTTVGHVIELSLAPYRSDVRRVLRVPRCATCSGVADQGAPVVAHASQLKG